MTVWKTEKYREIILFSEFGSIVGDKINIPKSIILGCQNVCSGFSVTSYGKTQMDFLANSIDN